MCWTLRGKGVRYRVRVDIDGIEPADGGGVAEEELVAVREPDWCFVDVVCFVTCEGVDSIEFGIRSNHTEEF